MPEDRYAKVLDPLNNEVEELCIIDWEGAPWAQLETTYAELRPATAEEQKTGAEFARVHSY